MSTSWPVEIHPIGLAACGTVAWRFRGQLRVTAVIKATFSFVPGGVMELEEPDDVHADDIPFTGDAWTPDGLRPAAPGDPTDASRSIWAPGDLAPFRLQADVLLTGHARLPRGGGAVRLYVWGDEMLVDKTVQVADEEGDGAPIPLVYERAFGGAGSAENPVGTGLHSGTRLPDLLDPASPRRPSCFAPIPRTWPVRARLLGGVDPRALAAPVAEVPSSIDWSFFQAAPLDQRTDLLRGDEWIRIEGVSAAYPILATRLPGATAAGRVYGLADAPVPVAFRADALHLDADRERATITFRASFVVPSEDVLPRLVLLAGVELPGQTIRWPERVRIETPIDEETTQAPTLEIKKPAAEAPPPAPEARPARQGTTLLEWPEGKAPARQGTTLLEWPDGAPPAPRRQSTVMLDWGDAGPPAPARPARQSTTMLEWPEGGPPPPPARQPTTMLEWPAPRAPLPTVAIAWGEGGAPDASNILEGTAVWSDDDSPLMGTMTMTDEEMRAAGPMRAPFAIAEAGSGSAPRTEIPNAPWASTRAPAAPLPTGEGTRPFVLPDSMSLPDDLLREVGPLPAKVAPPPAKVAPPPPQAPPRREIAKPRMKAAIAERLELTRRAR
jgi:hypothetical protein